MSSFQATLKLPKVVDGRARAVRIQLEQVGRRRKQGGGVWERFSSIKKLSTALANRCNKSGVALHADQCERLLKAQV